MCFELYNRQLLFWQPCQCCISWLLDWKGGPIPWPARSPDLNPLVFETPVEMGMDLVARIVAASDIIQNTPGILVRVRYNLVRRCYACIEVGGCQFEQLL